MGGRSGERRRAASVRTLSRRLEAAVGKEHAKTLLEIAEALTITEAQLERSEHLEVRHELLELRGALEAAARGFRS